VPPAMLTGTITFRLAHLPAAPSRLLGDRRAAGAVSVAACLALAGLSMLAPSAPTTDPWGWILWGRELVHLHLSTVVGGSPSWKPLPVLLTTPLALTGSAAPVLWLLVARAGALLSLVLAYRLAARLAGHLAGALAVVGMVLSTGWVRSFAHGYTEALAIGLLLLAIERAFAGRPRQALFLGAAVTLSRPEAWPLVVAYGAFLVWRRQASLPFALLVVAAVPALWVIPDWLGSDQLFHANKVAEVVVPPGAAKALGTAARIAPLPFSLAAVAGAAMALRARERMLLVMSGVVVAWTLVLVLLLVAGYTASPRFFVIPAGLFVVVGAVGMVRVMEAARPLAPCAVPALALALLVLPPLVGRTVDAVDAGRDTVVRANLESDLDGLIDREQPRRLRRCGFPALPRGLFWTRGVVAWEYGIPLRRVHYLATSAPGYIEDLGNPPAERLPGRPRGPVTVSARRGRFVFFSPFGRSPIMQRRRHAMLRSLGLSGPWRAVVSQASSDCPGLTTPAS
jgi:hypothetical protein